MSLEKLNESIPEYAKDLKLNLSSALRQIELTESQIWGSVACAVLTLENETLSETLLPEAEEKLGKEVLDAIRGITAVMGINNIYYRFTHLVSNKKYSQLPARLRMSALKNPALDSKDVELLSTVVSAINGCGICMDSHEKILVEQGVSEEAISAAVRIGAIIKGLSSVV